MSNKTKNINSIRQQYLSFKKSYSKKALGELETLSPKKFADKYFAGLKNRKSAQGKVRRLQQGKDLVEKTQITQKRNKRIVTHFHKKIKWYQRQYTSNGVTRYWKIHETSYNSDDSSQFQFTEVQNDTKPICVCISNNQDAIEKMYEKLPKKAKNFKYIKLFFSFDYEFDILDKSTGIWTTYPDTFEYSYAILYKKNVSKAILHIIKTIQAYFTDTDSRNYLIKSPLHSYIKVVKS
jgi:hypothetical protein